MTRLGLSVMDQQVAYWAPFGLDQFGRPTWLSPVSVYCRWEETCEEYVGPQGTDEVSKVRVVVDTDLEVGGFLVLHDFLSGIPGRDPRIEGALEIRSFQKTKTLRGDGYVRTVFLR